MIKLAINGFGRIGRTFFRVFNKKFYKNNAHISVTVINDLANINTIAYLLKYDSVHGKFNENIKIYKNLLIVNKRIIKVYSESNPIKLPWKIEKIDIVLEATGRFLDKDNLLKHIKAGAKKVVVSAPYKNSDSGKTICYGINHNEIKNNDQIISTASCTTNSLAPIVKVINDNFTIDKALVTTIHSYTSDQNILDLPHSDMRRSRAAGLSIIPTTTGAVRALSLIFPKLEGNIDGIAIRVPTPNVSLVDLVITISKYTTLEDINSILKSASKTQFKGIISYIQEPLVSVDMIGVSESSIIDSLSTKVIKGNFIKILAWYDNEWGFASRVVDLISFLSKKL